MKPIRLECEAFGVFLEPTIIDFQTAGNSGLFLISGAIGSGKSTIFDALSFALFGKTISTREVSDLISTFSRNDAVETKVKLIFESFEQGIFSITRTLTKNSNNTHEKNALICSVSSNYTENSKVCEGTTTCTKAIERLTGYTYEEFKKVVIIPQGQFRDFLLSSHSERERLLSVMFGAEHFIDFTKSLKSIAVDRRKLAEQKMAEIAAIARPYSSAADIVILIEKIQVEIENLRANISTTNDEIETRREALEILRAKETNLAALADLEKKLRKHNHALPAIEKRKKQIERANNAFLLRPDAEHAKELARILTEKRKLLSNHILESASIDRHMMHADIALGKAQRFRNEIENLQAESIFISQKQPFLERLKQLLDEQATLTQRKKELKKELLEREHILEKCTQTLADIATMYDAVKAEAEKAEQAMQASETHIKQLRREESLRSQLHQTERLIAAQTTELQTLFSRMESARIIVETARKAFDDIDLAYRTIQAQLLSRSLRPGLACPVCGSVEHLELAHTKLFSEKNVTKSEYDLAYSTFIEMQHLYNLSVQNFSALSATRERTLARLSGLREHFPPEALSISFDTFRKNAQTYYTEFEQLKTKRDKFLHIVDTKKGAEEALSKAKNGLIELRFELENVSEQLEFLELNLSTSKNVSDVHPELFNSIEQLSYIQKTIIQHHDFISSAHDEYNSAKLAFDESLNVRNEMEADISELENEINELKHSLENRAQELGFQNIREGLQYVMEQSKIDELTSEITDWELEKARLELELQTTRTELNCNSSNDLQNAIRALAEVETSRDKDIERLGALQQQIVELQAKIDSMTELRVESDELWQQEIQARRIAEVADGKNPFHLKFASFVLSKMLDEIIKVANNKMNILFSGRYLLIRSEQPATGTRLAGLEIDVFDNFTNSRRSARTLSGGEMFLASLALSLAAADVAVLQTNGKRLRAMFIDEGFGSLDAESLEIVISVLKKLASEATEHGLLLGIISHVPSLQEAISPRLNVVKSPEGSHIEWFLAPKSTINF